MYFFCGCNCYTSSKTYFECAKKEKSPKKAVSFVPSNVSFVQSNVSLQFKTILRLTTKCLNDYVLPLYFVC